MKEVILMVMRIVVMTTIVVVVTVMIIATIVIRTIMGAIAMITDAMAIVVGK